ncbi:Bifunctional transcriptional activator/DNA repair enzyme AdaA [compost metagenome]
MCEVLMIQRLRIDNEQEWNKENQQTVLNDFYFSLVTYGKCVYWVNDQKIIMDKGGILLIPRGNSFKWKYIPTIFHSKYVVEFNTKQDFTSLPLIMKDSHTHLQAGCFSILHEKMKIIGSQWTEKMPYYEVYASAVFTEVLIHINRELDRGPLTSDKYRNAELMKNYIRENYRSKITKEDLADVIQKSPNYTATLFSSVTGQTISEYVHSIRVKKALYMLEESQFTVAELSEFLGYSDVSYFSRVFKQIIGVSPSDYAHHKLIYL